MGAEAVYYLYLKEERMRGCLRLLDKLKAMPSEKLVEITEKSARMQKYMAYGGATGSIVSICGALYSFVEGNRIGFVAGIIGFIPSAIIYIGSDDKEVEVRAAQLILKRRSKINNPAANSGFS
jgi:hypothetical protein